MEAQSNIGAKNSFKNFQINCFSYFISSFRFAVAYTKCYNDIVHAVI